ncbi:hypothetical protein B0H17DRAFT_1144155 [Mycena rosella]|uniref:Uncharacterized protein n=1 Tax=Mycena rosella TaxID=1033263 RepID=A0AAD7G3R9_MYCRO|nr:hypothetical protein B0H17DRAFT_1144155 [Mycena rosella]
MVLGSRLWLDGNQDRCAFDSGYSQFYPWLAGLQSKLRLKSVILVGFILIVSGTALLPFAIPRSTIGAALIYTTANIFSRHYFSAQKTGKCERAWRNTAVWGYWKDVKRYAEGTKKANSGWFEALTDETGWSWTIPPPQWNDFHWVRNAPECLEHQKGTVMADGKKPTLTEHYLDQLQFVPGAKELVGENGKMIPGSIKSAADYNFVDPFFSSGVHIAMTGALSAALTICASIKSEVAEETAQEWHDTKVGIAHTRFLFVVLGAYQKMHLQAYPILSDVNAKNFDEAFKMFRPVIYGLADSSKELTDAKVQEMMDTCRSFFDPYVNEEHVKAVRQRYGTEVIQMESPVLGRQKIKDLVKDDADAERVLNKYDVLRVFSDDVEATHMGRDPLLGYIATVKRGELGLTKVVAEEVRVSDAQAK